MAQGSWSPVANVELVQKVQALLDEVRTSRALYLEHIYGHTGEHDNELTDKAAEHGAQGRVSRLSKR